MIGNLGVTEWAILSVVIIVVIRLFNRRREPAGMSPEEQAQLRRVLDALDRMERRIENLEVLIDQQQGIPEAEAHR